MSEIDLLQLALQYGPGLVIAVIVLVWKRMDDRIRDQERQEEMRWREEQRAEEKQWREEQIKTLKEIINENSAAIRAQTEAIRNLYNVFDIETRMTKLEERLTKRQKSTELPE